MSENRRGDFLTHTVCMCMFYSGDHLVWLIGCLSEGGHVILIVPHFSGRLIQASYIYCQKTCSLNYIVNNALRRKL